MTDTEILTINGLDVIVQRCKIKNTYFSIKDGKAYMKVSKYCSKEKIMEMIESKEKWYRKNLQKSHESREIDLKNKEYIYILGNKIKIEYIYEDRTTAKILLNENECKILLPKGIILTDAHYQKMEKKLDSLVKSLSSKYIYDAMKKYIALTGLTPKEIKIGKFKSFWGNCSSKKIIKMNQKLIYYGIPQIEYVCLHELTHLRYMNHQKDFWEHVKKYMPEYKQISSVLK